MTRLMVIAQDPNSFLAARSPFPKNLPTGCETLTVRTTDEAVAQAALSLPDALLLDGRAGGEGPLLACRRLKSDPATVGIPLLLALADGTPGEDRSKALEAGADDVVSWAAEPAELAARVRLWAHLRRAEERSRLGAEELARVIAEHERAFAESVETSVGILMAIPSGVLIYRFEPPDRLTLLAGNPAAERLTGLTLDEARGREFDDLWPALRGAGFKKSLLEVMDSGEPFMAESLRYEDSRLKGLFSVRAFRAGEKRLGVIFEDVTRRRRTERALIENEARFRGLVETSQNLIWQCDWRLRFTYANPVWEQALGYDPEDMLKQPIGKFQPPDIAERDATVLRGLLRGESLRGYETELLARDGRRLTVILNAIPIRRGKRKITGLQGTAYDITERKKAEEQVRQLSQFLEVVIDSANVWLYALDAQANVAIWNRAAESVSGYRRDEVIGGRGVWDFLYPDPEQRRQVVETLEAVIRQGLSLDDYETVIRTRGGEDRTISWRMQQLLDDRRRPIGCVALGRDITARKRIAQDLAERERRIRAIFEAADAVSFITTDLNGADSVILEFSPGAERIFGYAREEALGKPVAILHVPEDVAWIPEMQQALRESKTGRGGEMTLVRKSGERFPALFTAYPLLDADGKMTAALGVAIDISARKNLEDQLRQSQKMEAIGRLAGGIAHDFNNLITAITGYSELVLSALPPDDAIRADIEEIRHAGERAAKLTRQLLAFSRRQVLQPRLLDLNAEVRDIEKMLRRVIGEDIELATELEKNLGSVKADPGQIEQVIMNLAVNARDAMPDGGRLTLRTANVDLDEQYARTHLDLAPGPYVRLSVADTGCGMDRNVLAHLFEPFFTTKEHEKGTGLGLSTVYGIVKQSGGHISVESRVGEGSRFDVYLPRVSGTAAPERRPPPRRRTCAEPRPFFLWKTKMSCAASRRSFWKSGAIACWRPGTAERRCWCLRRTPRPWTCS